ELPELPELLLEHASAVHESLQAPLQAGPPEEPEERVHGVETLLHLRGLLHHRPALLSEALHFLGDGVEPTLALRERGLVELGALPLLPLQLELLRELLEALRAHAPEMAQLEVNHGVRGGERVGEQALEAL